MCKFSLALVLGTFSKLAKITCSIQSKILCSEWDAKKVTEEVFKIRCFSDFSLQPYFSPLTSKGFQETAKGHK